MALADSTFKFYTDSGLTAEFTGIFQLTHETDLSDNPQDNVLYLGSVIAGRQLQADSNPGVDDITMTPTDTLADWVTVTAYSLGDRIEPTTPNTYSYECTTAGTSGASEPTFPTAAIGDTVADGTVVWTMQGKRHEVTEIKLALTAGGLPGATGGAALVLGTTILAGVGNAVEVNIRVTNAVTTVRNTTVFFEIDNFINNIVETQV